MIDFSEITACGECCTGCEKKIKVYAQDVLKQMDLYLNGHNQEDVKFMHVPEIMMYSFADCVKNFLVNDYHRWCHGILILLNT